MQNVVRSYAAMNRDELREKIRVAAIHFTEEVSAIFGEAFACILLSAFVFTAGYVKIKNTGEFYEIR